MGYFEIRHKLSLKDCSQSCDLEFQSASWGQPAWYKLSSSREVPGEKTFAMVIQYTNVIL